MESRRIAVGAIVAAAVLVFILSSSVFGCLPADDGACLAAPAPLRIGNMEGESDVPSVRLNVTMRTMKSDLLQFVDGIPNLSWRGRDINKLAVSDLGIAAVPVQRGVRIPAVVTLPDSDLAHIETGILMRDAPANLVQVRRLEAVTREIARREQDIVLARIRRLNALALAKASLVAVPAPAPALPGSPDPYNAPAPTGQQVYIAARSTVWYSISDRGRRLTMWIDANNQSGLTMSIYGPDQQDVWNTRPAGKAAPGEGHDFFWTGRSAFKGFWRIRLTNANDFAVPYSFTATAVSDKNGDLCRDCHGIIEDEWDRCEHSGSFCEDLKDQYKN